MIARLPVFCIVVAFILAGCSTRQPTPAEPTLLQLVDSAVSGISFANQLTYTEEFNVYTYRSFYNGAGVGLGDINNDGLLDILFCGNQVSNRLYLNLGNFRFRDITREAGLSSSGIWSTGVSMVDIDGDGWLDIYVCKSGNPKGDRRYNELFINNHDLTFTERAAEFGLNDKGLSTHAVFFDFDHDGDLDAYLLNNSFRSVGNYDLRKGQRNVRDLDGGNRLYRNDKGHFKDVSEHAGIYGSSIGFGLGVTVSDLDRDGWDDLYVSNDFFERDYLYLNNRNGTFTECLESKLSEISMGSMGADIADINNDGWPEIFVTEMLPEKNDRLKTKAQFDNWEKYRLNIENGYFRQFPRNVLQRNNSDGSFSEIGRLAGVSATDWSWGALMTDFDNDGQKDLFVANGIYKDLLDQDYINFMADPNTVREILQREGQVIKHLVDSIPSVPLSNYAFKNFGEFRFENKASEWGLDKPGFSSGSAYGDLDNDGDMDLVVNNVNMPAFVYRNLADSLLPQHRYLKFVLKGTGSNSMALGTQVTVWLNGNQYYQELAPMRGFQSSVDGRLNFGLGKIELIDSVVVDWPDAHRSVLRGLKTNQTILLDQSSGVTRPSITGQVRKPLFAVQNPPSLDYRHQENDYVDFDRDRLLYHMMSNEGPRMSSGDVNGDGLEDLYIGGSRDQAGILFEQTSGGTWRRTDQLAFEQDKVSEDTGSTFFDADGDGDLDLYVCSGGNELFSVSPALIDRLYINDGRGKFSKSQGIYPTMVFENTSVVRATDVDSDGDQDLFVGVRMDISKYGMPMSSYLLINDGHGNLEDKSAEMAPGLKGIGMVTDGQWADVDGDKDQDLVVVGDWMPIRIFYNEGGRLTEASGGSGLSGSAGWWNRLEAADLDGDGDVDFVAGNHGENSRFKASQQKPVSMYVKDFDQNGKVEQILCTYNGEKSYPLALRHDLIQQLPMLKKKYLKYASYRDQTITDVFTEAQLDQALVLKANTLSTSIIINEGGGQFTVKPLPVEAQLAPVFAICIGDFDRDGKLDVLLAGNSDRSKPEVGSYLANHGVFLRGDGKMNFTSVWSAQSGFFVEGEVRDIKLVRSLGKRVVLILKNNGYAETFNY